jgi:hypothetical protein
MLPINAHSIPQNPAIPCRMDPGHSRFKYLPSCLKPFVKSFDLAT